MTVRGHLLSQPFSLLVHLLIRPRLAAIVVDSREAFSLLGQLLAQVGILAFRRAVYGVCAAPVVEVGLFAT